jgi:hypothetical protein
MLDVAPPQSGEVGRDVESSKVAPRDPDAISSLFKLFTGEAAQQS